jgi:hypothetical protein
MALGDFGRYLYANRKLWLPPVIVTVAIFVALMAFGPGKPAMMFVYKIF